MADDEQFSLCWNNFNSNLSAGFHESLCRGDLVDVTLAAEGQFVKAHRLVLSVCSPYFRKMFTQMPANQHAFVFLKDVSHSALKDLIQFMYCGEVNVKQDALPAFISTAEALQIKGLTDGDPAPSQSPAKPSTPAPQPTTVQQTLTSPRVKARTGTRSSYKIESIDDSGDDKASSQIVLQTTAPQTTQQTTTTLVQTTVHSQKRPAQRSISTPQTKRAKNTADPLEASEPTTTQITVQNVAESKSTTNEPEFIDLPIELPTKSEPDYSEDAQEVETAEQEATYVEDDSYGDMKYDESYFTENEEANASVSGAGAASTSAVVAKTFSDTSYADAGDQSATEAQERRLASIKTSCKLPKDITLQLKPNFEFVEESGSFSRGKPKSVSGTTSKRLTRSAEAASDSDEDNDADETPFDDDILYSDDDKLEEVVHNLETVVSQLDRREFDDQSDDAVSDSPLSLPCKTVSQVELLEKKLEDKTFYLFMEDYITSLMMPDEGVDRTIRKCLKSIFSLRVATQYNWSGQGSCNKKPVSGLLVIAIIMDIAKKRFPNSKSDIAYLIQRWFRYSQQKLAKRKHDDEDESFEVIPSLESIKMQIDRSELRLDHSRSILTELPFRLPLEELSQLEHLERKLLENKEMRKMMEDHISSLIVPENVVAWNIRKCLYAIFGHPVAVMYNWTGSGSGGKKSARNLRIVQALREIINSNFPDSKIESEHAFARWFRYAVQRDKYFVSKSAAEKTRKWKK